MEQTHNDQQLNASDEEAIRIPIGQQLKQKREQLGITQQEIADRLCLKVSVVEKIETQSFEETDLTIFVRGYFRTYAKIIGMDEEVVLQALEEDHLLPTSEQKMTSFSNKTHKKKHESRMMLFTWLVVLIIVGASAIWLWQKNSQDDIQTNAENASMATESLTGNQEINLQNSDTQDSDDHEVNNQFDDVQFGQVVTTTGYILGPEDDSSEGSNTGNNTLENDDSEDTSATQSDTQEQQLKLESVENAGSAQNPPITETATPSTDVVDTAETEKSEQVSDVEKLAPPQLNLTGNDTNEQDPEQQESQQQEKAVTENHLVVTFANECWVQIKDKNGKTLTEGTKWKGDKAELTGDMPYYLKLGTIKGVSITLGGEAVDLSKYSIGRTVRLTLE